MSKTIHAPRFLLAAPKSGSGKTFVTCGILQRLKEEGKKISAFKCGPDYIDPMFHKMVLGLPSKNLDTFFSGEALTKSLFAEDAEKSDISVIEGVMGFYDGVDLPEHRMLASAYDLARTTQTPVVLVVDAKGMSRSLIPLLKGFMDYGEEKLIRGVILNRISPGMYPVFSRMIREELGIMPLGYLPVMEGSLWESRHLGLVQPEEIRELREQVERISAVFKDTLDLEGLLRLAESAPALEAAEIPLPPPLPGEVTIGVARDEAFSFYYEDNLRLMQKLGSRLVEFSPLRDKELPEADGFYFGGGYPELYAGELSANKEMLAAVRQAAQAGFPILAECGGFMYLQESLKTKDGINHPMAGVLPGKTEMTEKLVRFGYLTLEENAERKAGNGLLAKGEQIRGHEFHYFDSTENGNACIAKKPTGKRQWECIAVKDNIFAGYPHLYYYSCPAFLQRFLRKCLETAGARRGNERAIS